MQNHCWLTGKEIGEVGEVSLCYQGAGSWFYRQKKREREGEPCAIFEGSLEVKLPTIWTDEKQGWEESEKRREERESLRRKKIQVREKVGKSRNTMFFLWFVAPEGWKVGSLKRRVRSQLARWEMKNCTPLWREAHFQVKMYKTRQLRITFRSCDVEKSARRCGAKHISKSKCTKHTSFGPLLEVAMSKSACRCGAKHISKSKV